MAVDAGAIVQCTSGPSRRSTWPIASAAAAFAINPKNMPAAAAKHPAIKSAARRTTAAMLGALPAYAFRRILQADIHHPQIDHCRLDRPVTEPALHLVDAQRIRGQSVTPNRGVGEKQRLTANSIERTALVAHGWRAVQPDAGAQLRRPLSVAATASVRMSDTMRRRLASTSAEPRRYQSVTSRQSTSI